MHLVQFNYLLKENKNAFAIAQKEKNQKYPDIEYAIRKVKSGELSDMSICINNYWVEIEWMDDSGDLNVTAVSDAQLKSVGNKDYEFDQLGFVKTSCYEKYISASTPISQIVKEIKTIFESIYCIQFQTYKIERSESEPEPELKLKQTNVILNRYQIIRYSI